MSDQPLKIAVFIDFDNVEIGVKTTLGLHFDVGAVLEAIKERGEIITKVAYSDWKRSGDHGRAMANYAVRLVQRVMTPGGDKNGADINLALDALEMAFTHDHINAFVIVGGDSDFITLVEKLKQYDKKVFVVGGRSFTSQVMQKNCTEFIAYENIAPDRRGSAASQPRSERGRGPATSFDQAMPLVSRALQVLTDREVTPQLGLLKSTLLQLDSSFSERDYGVSSFRDFAERLAQRGFVTLRHNGRSTLVELADGAPAAETPADGETPAAAPAAESTAPRDTAVTPAPNVADGVAILRRVLADPPTPPRWPMYLRQMKQFLRTAEPEFDERKHGSIVDVMRAGQKDGLVRLERDRQGGLRVFSNQPAATPAAPPPPPSSGQVYQPKKVTVGWTLGQDVEDAVEVQEDVAAVVAASPADAVVTEAPAAADAPADAQPALALDAPAAAPVVIVDAVVEDEEPHDSQTNFFGPEGIIETPIPGAPRRQRRTRKTAAAPASEAKPKRARKTAGGTRKTAAAPRTRRKTTEK